MTWWRFVRWLIASEAAIALWWFVWGWTEAALIVALAAVGTAGYYLLTPGHVRQLDDSAPDGGWRR